MLSYIGRSQATKSADLTAPTGVVAGDLLVVNDGGTGAVAAGQGWTHFAQTGGETASPVYQCGWYKFATGNDAWRSGNSYTGRQMVAFRGVKPGVPTYMFQDSLGDFTFPAATPTTDSLFVYLGDATGGRFGVWDTPWGTTPYSNDSGATLTYNTYVIHYEIQRRGISYSGHQVAAAGGAAGASWGTVGCAARFPIYPINNSQAII
jgi:hypothetical protein